MKLSATTEIQFRLDRLRGLDPVVGEKRVNCVNSELRIASSGC